MNKPNVHSAVCALIITLASVISFAASRPEAHVYEAFRGDHCEACGSTQDLQWAHCYPYNLAVGTDKAYLIVAQTNGITLDRHCHLRIAHYGNFSKFWNINLIPDVKYVHDHNGDLPPDFESHRAEYKGDE